MARKPSNSKKEALLQSSTAEFEELLRKTKSGEHYVLSLYITGTTSRSSAAISTIHALCEEYLSGRYELKVVDIYQQPSDARIHQIIAAPTLIKTEPLPVKRLIGDLADRERVLVGLNISDRKLVAAVDLK